MDFKVKHPIGLVDALACEKGTEKGQSELSKEQAASGQIASLDAIEGELILFTTGHL